MAPKRIRSGFIVPKLSRSACNLGAGLLIASLLTACQSGDKVAEREPLLVDSVIAEVSNYPSSTSLAGEIHAETSADLAFEVNGQVVERLVNVGDRVHAGEVLARLSAAEQRADLDAARAALDAANSKLVQSRADMDRQSSLVAGGLVTRSAYDLTVEVLATSTSAVASAQAAYEQASEALDHTELRAFADGIITANSLELGQVVQAGQSAFTVASDGARKAIFYADEGVLTDLFSSQKFHVQMFDRPEIDAEAVLTEISPTIDVNSGSVKVTLLIADPPPEMTLGSVVSTTAQYRSTEAVVLPARALTSENGAAAVWVVDPATLSVSRRPITMQSFDSESLIVTAGVTPGERVVTAGANLVYPQQIVALKD